MATLGRPDGTSGGTGEGSGSVRIVPGKQSAGGLETRGARPSASERYNQAQDVLWDKAERYYDFKRITPEDTSSFRGSKGKNAAHIEALKNQKPVIKIDSSKVRPNQIIKTSGLQGRAVGGLGRIGGHAK